MDITTSLVIIAIIGLIHASFQLSISMLTLLSSHTIGKRRSRTRLLLLTHAFVIGVAVATTLLLSTMALFAGHLLAGAAVDNTLLWTLCVGMMFGLGASVWLFYYRREKGTTLWIPRSMAKHLASRAKATKHSAEAFGLGLTSVIAELLFVAIPLLAVALVLIGLEPRWQLAGIGLYVATSLLPLMIVNLLISQGLSISRIQRWREQNKGFLQFSAGAGLLALGFYLYVEEVMTPAVMAAAGSF